MSDVIITPSILSGDVTVPCSKSDAHRAIISASLANGISRISPVQPSDDISATIGAMKELGAEIKITGNEITVKGITNDVSRDIAVNCMESGSTLRFLIPVAAALGIRTTFTGKGRLPERPNGPLTKLLREHDVTSDKDFLPLTISGKLSSGEYSLPGNISSQYISGLLMALPLTGKECIITLTSDLESAAYVDMTIHTMSKYGVTVEKLDHGYKIPGGQVYKSAGYTVEGDWSAASFYLAAGAIGGNIRIHGLSPDSLQGDRAAVNLFKQFGAKINFQNGVLEVEKGALNAITINAEQIPDMVPSLAVTAAFANGETRIVSAGRLRMKESDRLSTTAAALTAMGVRVKEQHDGLIITGQPEVAGGSICGANDHRIVMAAAIAAAYATSDSKITIAEAVNKSYPDFFKDYNKLGGLAHVL